MAFGLLLQQEIPPDELPPGTLANLQAERTRWLAGLDDSTRWLLDHSQSFAQYFRGGLPRSMALQYSMRARITWISAVPEAEKVRYLTEMTERVEVLFFERRWRLSVILRAQTELQQLMSSH